MTGKLSIEDMVLMNEEYETSALTIEKFAQSKSMKKFAFAWIRKRVKRHLESQSDIIPDVSFTKIQHLLSAPTQEIRLEVNGVNVFIEDDFNVNTLVKLLRVLQND